ncbi:fused MFS/spermidine synthase [Aliikangiella maris]|uniref:Fused MFS/spermidine synthase n=2 Tax=Aliikangiella maris TaxID=3162458 RepID=A0ABV2BRU5_9GAMM
MQASASRLKIILFSIFALSGFSGLIYESIWTHYIKLILGHAAYSQTLVLSIFMGGMAIGAALTGRHKDKPLKTPLKYYALIEGVIAIFAFAFHSVFVASESLLHETLIPALDSVILIETVRWGLAALLILPQSILLGTTFPLIGTAVIRLDEKHSGSTLGMLYFTNSIGAAMGVLVSGFVLIGLVGLPGTIMTAGIINIFIAIVVWGLSKSERTPEDILANNLTTLESEPVNPQKDFSPNWLFAIALLTGLASFLYEIGWIRMLSLVLGSSMQAFELMLSAFITGLAFGGLWIRKRIQSTTNPAFFLGKIQIIMGLCAVATLPLYTHMFDFMGFMVNSLNKNEGGYLLFNLSSHLISMLIMLPATFMAGMTLPLITFTLLKWKQGEASIGRVYAFNTVGAIIGTLIAVHLLMPLIGTKGLIVTGALVDIGLGLFLVFKFIENKPRLKVQIYSVASIIAFLTISVVIEFDQLKMASGVYRHGRADSVESTRTIFYKDGKTATISVNEFKSGSKSISTNGKPDAMIRANTQEHSLDEATMILAAALPLSLHPEATSFANIGMGSGLTSHTLMTSGRPITLDTIEIESAMVEGVSYFGESTEKSYTDSRSKIYIDDAKSFFSRNKKQYDVIISEPSNPWVSGVAGLFSEEFYYHINRYLANDGVLVQWLQLYETNISLFASVFKALDKNFKDYAIYTSNFGDIIIIASNGRSTLQLDSQLFDDPSLSNQLKRVKINNRDDLQATLIGNKQQFQPYFNSIKSPTNSDYFPYLSLNAPKARYLRENIFDITALLSSPFPPSMRTPYFTNKLSKEAIGSENITSILQSNAREIARVFNFSLSTELNQTNLNNKLSASALLISQFTSQCHKSTEIDNVIDDNLHYLALHLIPFRGNQEVNQFWDKLVNSNCIEYWPEHLKLWVNLYFSVAYNKHKEIIKYAKIIINSHPPKSRNKAWFLLGAALNSFILLEKTADAREFRDSVFKQIKLPNNSKYPLYLEILLFQINE